MLRPPSPQHPAPADSGRPTPWLWLGLGTLVTIIGLAVDGDESTIAGMPYLEYRPLRNGEPAAYLCEHFTCMPPVTTTEELAKLLDRGTGITWAWF